MTTKRAYKLQEFVAHSAAVNCLKIGRKSSRVLVTGGEDYKVNLWAIGKPNAILSLSGHTSGIDSVSFDSSEVLVAAGAASGTIKLWDLEEAKIVRTLTGHRSNCISVDFHPFGEFFASGSLDTNLKIWDIRKKGCIHTYKGHTRGVNTIRFTPDGRWVVSGGEDHIVKVWDLTAGKLLHDFKCHEGQIQCLDFHPHEFLLATGSADRTVKFWDLETFELIGSAGPETTGVRCVTFNPDGRTLLCGLQESIRYKMRCRARLPLPRRRTFPFLSSCHRSQTTQVTSLAEPAHSNYSTHQFSPTRVDLSSTDCSGISKDVIFQCPHIFGLKEKPFTKPASLKGLFLDLSDVMPEIARKFRRCSCLKSEDVLEILLGFQAEAGKVTLGARKVETLWEIFKWASDQRKDFKHLPRSYEVMASLLVRAGLLRKFELLLLAMEMQRVQLGCHEIFSNSIEAYLAVGDLGKALILLESMKKRKLVPSLPCFNAFIHALIQRKRTQHAFHLFLHMVEMSVNMSDAEKPSFESVIRLLCLDGRIHEARNLLKLTSWRSEPGAQVINEIALGYCKKKDFDDLRRFLAETKCLPDLIVCNKIIHTLCCDFSVERAELFRQELEQFGFSPDEITLGILLSWSCRGGNLRSAFLFLSEILARGLNPDILSYNAVIASVFMEGLWKLAQDILDEMLERGTKPNLSTFEVLLAGYCRERKFEEAKLTVLRMVDLGLVNPNSPQDHLSQAFATLGFSPSVVRLRRDNHVGFSKAEFCDTIGNGLYLDTDLDEYDERLSNILKEHADLDFNSLVMKECSKGNFKTALWIAEKTISWGQELFFPTCLTLLKGLSVSLSEMKAVTRLLDKTPDVANQLNSEFLNLIVQAYCKKGWAYKGSKLFYEMVQRDLTIKTETYTALIRGLCKRGFSKELVDCWDSARRNKWLPSLKDYKVLTRCLLRQDMLKEALQLFEKMIFSYRSLRLEICNLFIEELCDDGLTSIAHILVKLLSQRHCMLHLTSYSYLARALWKKKRKSDALAVLDIMISGSDLGGCVNRVPWLCGSDRFHPEMVAENTTSKAQSAFVEGFVINGKVGQAYSFHRLLLLKDLLLDIGVYDIVFEVHCLAKNVRKSRELLCLMIKDNVHLSTSLYRSWVRLMCTADKVTSVLAMKNFVLQQSPSSSLILFYNILVFYLLSAGRSSMVAKVLHEMQEKGLVPDEVTYNFLVYGFSVCGDMPSSALYLFTMISKGLRPSNRSLKIVMKWLFQIGDVKEAFGLSQEMELRGWPHCSVVQDLVAGALIGQGKVSEAKSYLDRLVDEGLLLGTVNYNNLIRKFCSCGRMKRAVDLLNIMLKKQNLPDLATYESVIDGFCARNELNRAMVFLDEMLDLGIQPSIRMWGTLVFQFCEEGRTAEAEECMVSMVCCGQAPTREMYVEVIEKYRSQNKVKKVSEMMQRMQESGYEPDFDTHWSLISKLSSSGNDGSSSDGFLLRLLSGSGFISNKSSKT